MSCKVARLGSATPASTGNGPAAETCQNGDPTTMSGIPISGFTRSMTLRSKP